MHKHLLLTVLSVLLIGSSSFCGTPSAGSGEKNVESSAYQQFATLVIRKCQDFKVTGDGQNEAWKQTGWVELTQREQNIKPYITRAKVLYSATGIYFLVDCRDTKLTSSMNADNMDLWNEDVVEVFLWTSEDFPVYFEYEISPLNYELPIMVPNYKDTFLGWLPWHYDGERRIQHATSATGGKKESGAAVQGWTAEFFIPYKLLAPLPQVPPVSGTKWRANIYRIDYDNGAAHYAWQMVGKSFHDYKNFGIFIFE
ncbi:MAG: carbohydrate-binding family 9-like protein [Bacteroidales bacterium]|nr:carbohydrate-binding family 9-like protein [Bacteroidales bacterium]